MCLDSIGIITNNINLSLKFYSFLGLDFKQTGEGEHFEASTDSGIRVMLDSVELLKKIDPLFLPPSGSGIVLCFKQSTADKVDSLVQTLSIQGYEVIKDPWDAFWGQRYASIKSPEGNQIDLFAQL